MKDEFHEQKFIELLRNSKFIENGCLEWLGPFDTDGYGHTTLTILKKRKTWKVHRLMFYLLKQVIPEDKIIMHLCDNPKCFNICHLSTGTYKENSEDRQRKGRGRDQKGEKNHMCTYLTEKEILEIRDLYKNGMRIKDLCKTYDMHQSTISKIVHKQRWKHI